METATVILSALSGVFFSLTIFKPKPDPNAPRDTPLFTLIAFLIGAAFVLIGLVADFLHLEAPQSWTEMQPLPLKMLVAGIMIWLSAGGWYVADTLLRRKLRISWMHVAGIVTMLAATVI